MRSLRLTFFGNFLCIFTVNLFLILLSDFFNCLGAIYTLFFLLFGLIGLFCIGLGAGAAFLLLALPHTFHLLCSLLKLFGTLFLQSYCFFQPLNNNFLLFFCDLNLIVKLLLNSEGFSQKLHALVKSALRLAAVTFEKVEIQQQSRLLQMRVRYFLLGKAEFVFCVLGLIEVMGPLQEMLEAFQVVGGDALRIFPIINFFFVFGLARRSLTGQRLELLHILLVNVMVVEH